MGSALSDGELARHPDPEPAFGVRDGDLHRVDLVGPLVPGLDGRGRELGARGDPGYPARQAGDGVGPIHPDGDLLAQGQPGHLGVADVGTEGERVERGQLEERLAGLDELAGFDVSRQHGTGQRAPDPASRELVVDRGDLRLDGCHILLRPGPGRPGPGQVFPHHTGALLGLIMLLSRGRGLLPQPLGPAQLPVGDGALHLERRDVRARLVGTRDRGGPSSRQLLPLDQQGNGVHHSEHRVPGDPVSFLQAEGQEPASDLRGDGDLRRLEVAVGVGLLAGARGQGESGENREPHGVSLAVVVVSPNVVR
jgi:hypothetical protein